MIKLSRPHRCILMLAAALVAAPAFAQGAQQLADDATRYMAMGDSLVAGFKAQPVDAGVRVPAVSDWRIRSRAAHALQQHRGRAGYERSMCCGTRVLLALIPAARGGFQAQCTLRSTWAATTSPPFGPVRPPIRRLGVHR